MNDDIKEKMQQLAAFTIHIEKQLDRAMNDCQQYAEEHDIKPSVAMGVITSSMAAYIGACIGMIDVSVRETVKEKIGLIIDQTSESMAAQLDKEGE